MRNAQPQCSRPVQLQHRAVVAADNQQRLGFDIGKRLLCHEGVDADKAHTEFKNGVLSISVPKRPEAQPRKISVTSK